MLQRLFSTALLLLVALPAGARADADTERITGFRSNIGLSTDGSLGVTETITVISRGDRIVHGIFRDFPTLSRDRYGNRRVVPFAVYRVLRDGQPEPYELQALPTGQRVKIGSGEATLAPGEHIYEISYGTARQVMFFPEFDELYWNVTGNGWELPIEHASAIVRLPSSASIRQYATYMGPMGSTATNAVGAVQPDGSLLVNTNQPLGAREGLTIAVAFAKGTITPPAARQVLTWWLRDNRATVTAFAGLVALVAFYLFTWMRFGRDPAPGTVIPLFAPPDGLSPAATRFVRRMGFDRKAFTAALVSMAVKGYFRISESGGEFTLHRTGRSEVEAGLAPGESALARQLVPAGESSIVLQPANHGAVEKAVNALSKSLAGDYERQFFVSNRRWFIGGVLILAATALLFAGQSGSPDDTFDLLAFTGVAGAVIAYVGSRTWRRLRAPRLASGRQGSGEIFFGILIVGGIVFAARDIPAWRELLPGMALLGLQGVLAVVFSRLLKAPTQAGARLREQVDGFRMYLNTAEKQRLEVLHPPQVTPEVFERFLPYAIALDAENAWSRRLHEELEAAGRNPGRSADYEPSWYSGSRGASFSQLGAAGLASTLGHSVAASASTAASSGSSGSSGGGGGGGGGGGW